LKRWKSPVRCDECGHSYERPMPWTTCPECVDESPAKAAVRSVIFDEAARRVAGNTVPSRVECAPAPKLGRAHALPAPTKIERAYHDALRRLGCVVCLRAGLGYVAPEVHHLLDGQRRRGHMVAIGLCPAHHQRGTPGRPSRHGPHGGVQRFEAAYGREADLLAWTLERVDTAWSKSA